MFTGTCIVSGIFTGTCIVSGIFTGTCIVSGILFTGTCIVSGIFTGTCIVSGIFTGTYIVSGSEDHTVIVWSLQNCKKLYEIKAHSDAVTAVRLVVRLSKISVFSGKAAAIKGFCV
jgi:WD40 repeat protein